MKNRPAFHVDEKLKKAGKKCADNFKKELIQRLEGIPEHNSDSYSVEFDLIKKGKLKLIKGGRYDFKWVDTYNFLGWHFEEDIDTKSIDKEFQSTIGYFIKEKKDWYIVAMHKNPNTELGFADWGNIAYLPKGSVRKIKKLG